MSYQVIKQPNGDLALWSNKSTTFCMLQTNKKSIVTYLSRVAKARIEKEITEILQKLAENRKPYYQFTLSWDKALERIRELHGDEEAEHIKKLIEENS
jgi:hypothetical protein